MARHTRARRMSDHGDDDRPILLDVECARIDEGTGSGHAVCAQSAPVAFTFTVFFSAGSTNTMVGYITDRSRAFISDSSLSLVSSVFPKQQAGLYTTAGAGIFPKAVAPQIQARLRRKLNQRDNQVREYIDTFQRIIDVERAISESLIKKIDSGE